VSSPWPPDLTFTAFTPAITTIGNDAQTIVGRSQRAGTINAVTYIPAGTQAGADTHTRTVSLFNRTSGVTVATLALVSGVNLTDNTAKVITLTTTLANRTINVGDILEWESLHVSNGIADPGGLVIATMALRS
jgi:hypothetical protein